MKRFPSPLVCCVFVFEAGAMAQADGKRERLSLVVEMKSGVTPPLPDFRTRTRMMLRGMVAPAVVLELLPATGWNQAWNSPEEWGRGASGVCKRLATQYGQLGIGETIELGVSVIRNEDPRYFRLGQGGAWRRTAHVFKNTIGAHRAGSPGMTIATGRIAGVFGSRGIALQWNSPSQQTWGNFLVSGSIGMLAKTGRNGLREFWPDAKRWYAGRKQKP